MANKTLSPVHWKNEKGGKVAKAKARLVPREFSQQEGIHHFDAFAPTPSQSYIRHEVADASKHDLDLKHFGAEQGFEQ